MMDGLINLLDICETGTRELGPGLRYVIWVQGCPFNCKGCITPEGIPLIENRLAVISTLMDNICKNDKIKGISISGGEPFMQAEELVGLLTGIRARRPELDVVVFSGYKIEELTWESALSLLKLIDVLIDGKYVIALNDNLGLRGSSNQRVHYLTGRLKESSAYFEKRQRSIEIHVYDRYQKIIGVPNKNLNL